MVPPATDGQNSAGLSYLRVPLGSSDFSDTRKYLRSYCEPCFRCLSLPVYRLYVWITHERRPRQFQHRQRAGVPVLHDRGHPVRQPGHQGSLAPLVPRERLFLLIQNAVLFILSFPVQPQWMKTSNSINGGEFIDSFTDTCSSSIIPSEYLRL